MVVIHTDPSATPMRSAVWAPLLASPWWCSSAPLGNPVVPEVYWIITASRGCTSGRVMDASSPAAMKPAQSSSRMMSRRVGQAGATCCTVASIGLPRNWSATNTPDDFDWFSTYCTSCARKAGLTVTSTSPASAQPNSSITHSGRLADHTATRSPGWKRVRNARAVRRDSACSSA